jgi:small-conductance mechanosensitive channel
MDNIKVGDVVRIKHWKDGLIMRQIKEIDLKYSAIRADDGEVYMLCNKQDEYGIFFF